LKNIFGMSISIYIISFTILISCSSTETTSSSSSSSVSSVYSDSYDDTYGSVESDSDNNLSDENAKTQSDSIGISEGERSSGEYADYTFVVSQGSKATFTVKEQLSRLPLPNDAVVITDSLNGEVFLDGKPFEVIINLQNLTSDQNYRDRYIRNRMFGSHPTAKFAISTLPELTDGFKNGEVLTGIISGSLTILDSEIPLEFEFEARDDGSVVYVVARTIFTWEQLNVPKPTAKSVVWLEDEVKTEILLNLTPR